MGHGQYGCRGRVRVSRCGQLLVQRTGHGHWGGIGPSPLHAIATLQGSPIWMYPRQVPTQHCGLWKRQEGQEAHLLACQQDRQMHLLACTAGGTGSHDWACSALPGQGLLGTSKAGRLGLLSTSKAGRLGLLSTSKEGRLGRLSRPAGGYRWGAPAFPTSPRPMATHASGSQARTSFDKLFPPLTKARAQRLAAEQTSCIHDPLVRPRNSHDRRSKTALPLPAIYPVPWLARRMRLNVVRTPRPRSLRGRPAPD